MFSFLQLTECFMSLTEVEIEGWIKSRHGLRVGGFGPRQADLIPVQASPGIRLMPGDIMRGDAGFIVVVSLFPGGEIDVCGLVRPAGHFGLRARDAEFYNRIVGVHGVLLR